MLQRSCFSGERLNRNTELKNVLKEKFSCFREKMRESFEKGLQNHFSRDSIPSGDEVYEAFEKENMGIFPAPPGGCFLGRSHDSI